MTESNKKRKKEHTKKRKVGDVIERKPVRATDKQIQNDLQKDRVR